MQGEPSSQARERWLATLRTPTLECIGNISAMTGTAQHSSADGKRHSS